MKLLHLSAISLTSALLLTTVSSAIFTPQVKANSVSQLTQLVANKEATANVIAQGDFVTVEQDHPTEGKAKIIEENGQRYLAFDADFTTAEGPAVKVLLHRSNSVSVNLNEEDYITIAPLQSFDGTQKYLIPDGVDLDEYQSVAIWCEQFNVTFGYAAL
ncbi:conserved exported hypothetical protein [Hyella patelloides LEGE 07179]|uniref:DM13 domain-containing protein n=1 Tax=Hyella patelloides LEGE 07179 TaxID=945734 RepID=A0A563VRH6_9CYAN|nr:DM13 domain-containing protein [Hyella patelloides]VEP13877.1 conserved exported hypothetical protein [Hyella patelloides LEGE 07179]